MNKPTHIIYTVCFFILVLLQNCWASCNSYVFIIGLDTISTQPDLQVVKRHGIYPTGTESPPGDTISRSEMLEKILDRYNSHDNVFIATADSCALDYSNSIRIRLCLDDDPDCDPFEFVKEDSIYVQIETVLKQKDSRIHDNYSFSIIQRDAKPYASLCGNRVLGFSNDISDDLTMLEGNVGYKSNCPPAPAGWGIWSGGRIDNIFIPPDAFFLNDNDEIIHRDYLGVSVPLDMFLTALEETSSVTNREIRRSFSGTVQALPNGSLQFLLPDTKANGTIRIAVFNLSGKRVGQWLAELNDGYFVLSPEQMNLSAGYYRFVVNDSGSGDAMHSFGHPIVR
ncbi:hypothetical protein QA601_06760 [Chitinispirillales bacterium ANBcel5]|uniref:hypothetical protein n=1 Tax=Cellulosispirillum alkaliphilum TaxID=3039283 RepID=UPI002A510D51|nr:hypothetical protein [Chitinispirillales bacterium ANBcel5]